MNAGILNSLLGTSADGGGFANVPWGVWLWLGCVLGVVLIIVIGMIWGPSKEKIRDFFTASFLPHWRFWSDIRQLRDELRKMQDIVIFLSRKVEKLEGEVRDLTRDRER